MIPKVVPGPVPAYGGTRSGPGEERYYLTNKQCAEYDAAAAIEDDAEWFEWWNDFKSRAYLIPIVPGPTRPMTSASVGLVGTSRSYVDDFDRTGWAETFSDTKNTDKRWWQKEWAPTYKGISDDTRKLAIAMSAVRATGRIIDDGTPPMTVEWATDAGNYTDTHANRMVISAKPIVDARRGTEEEQNEAIDIVTAELLHEVGHGNSRKLDKLYQQLSKEDYGEIQKWFANLLEDVRTERITTGDFPGFGWYLEALAEYTWNMDKGEKPDRLEELKDMAATAWGFLRSPENARAAFTDPSFAGEDEWWNALAERYCATDPKNDAEVVGEMRSCLNDVVEHIRHLLPPPPPPKEGEGEGEGEPAGQGATKDWPSPCTHDESGDADYKPGDRISREDAKESDQVIEEELREHNPERKDVPTGMRTPEVRVYHPVETTPSKRKFMETKLSPGSSRMRDAIRLRPDAKSFSERILRSGDIDEEELWRFGTQDYRLFQEVTIETTPHAHIGLMLDLSGSMTASDGTLGEDRKSRVGRVTEIALMFAQALKGMDGVTAEVWGHTGDNGRFGLGCDILELWKDGEPFSRLGIAMATSHGNNYDGFPIEYAAQQLMDRGNLDDLRLLIVLSDGEPYGEDYYPPRADEHVRNVVKRAERNGVTVIQIAVSSDLSPYKQSKMFTHWIGFTEVNKLIRDIGVLLDGTVNRMDV